MFTSHELRTKQQLLRDYFGFVSIDIETTGLDENECEILEIGLVICFPFEPEWDWPRMVIHPEYDPDCRWDAGIREMHEDLLRDRLFEPICKLQDVTYHISRFLGLHGVPTDGFIAAGKNFAKFDSRFLELLPYWTETLRAKHRVLDPAPHYWQPEHDGAKMPNLATCLNRAGLVASDLHRAEADAFDVARLLTKHITSKVDSTAHLSL